MLHCVLLDSNKYAGAMSFVDVKFFHSYIHPALPVFMRCHYFDSAGIATVLCVREMHLLSVVKVWLGLRITPTLVLTITLNLP